MDNIRFPKSEFFKRGDADHDHHRTASLVRRNFAGGSNKHDWAAFDLCKKSPRHSGRQLRPKIGDTYRYFVEKTSGVIRQSSCSSTKVEESSSYPQKLYTWRSHWRRRIWEGIQGAICWRRHWMPLCSRHKQKEDLRAKRDEPVKVCSRQPSKRSFRRKVCTTESETPCTHKTDHLLPKLRETLFAGWILSLR